MKTITINLYSVDELKPEAYQKAYEKWLETIEDPFMQSHMINLLGEKLEENGIKATSDPDVRYSLSHSQGDGFMFIGDFEYNGNAVKITWRDHMYTHSRTAGFNYDTDAMDGSETMTEKHQTIFEDLYRSICKEMEETGYDYIEQLQSEESFREECDANDYTFEENGKMRNVNN